MIIKIVIVFSRYPADFLKGGESRRELVNNDFSFCILKITGGDYVPKIVGTQVIN